MATINEAVSLLRAANAATPVQAGQMALTAQRIAMRSRSRLAHDVICSAHLVAVMSLDRATDQRDRSILGGVRAESNYLFRFAYSAGANCANGMDY